MDDEPEAPRSIDASSSGKSSTVGTSHQANITPALPYSEPQDTQALSELTEFDRLESLSVQQADTPEGQPSKVSKRQTESPPASPHTASDRGEGSLELEIDPYQASSSPGMKEDTAASTSSPSSSARSDPGELGGSGAGVVTPQHTYGPPQPLQGTFEGEEARSQDGSSGGVSHSRQGEEPLHCSA